MDRSIDPLIAPLIAISAACPFNDRADLDLLDAHAAKPVAFPARLFRPFRSAIGAVPRGRCEHAIEKLTFKVSGRPEFYTAYYTHRDACDGGNSYGVVVRGLEADPAAVVAFIRDSEFVCSNIPRPR